MATHDRPERQQSIRASFAWSWQRLTAAEQQTLAGLTIFPGAFSAAQAGAETEARPETLAALVRHALLIQCEPDQYQFDRLTRRLAAEHRSARPAL